MILFMYVFVRVLIIVDYLEYIFIVFVYICIYNVNIRKIFLNDFVYVFFYGDFNNSRLFGICFFLFLFIYVFILYKGINYSSLLGICL